MEYDLLTLALAVSGSVVAFGDVCAALVEELAPRTGDILAEFSTWVVRLVFVLGVWMTLWMSARQRGAGKSPGSRKRVAETPRQAQEPSLLLSCLGLPLAMLFPHAAASLASGTLLSPGLTEESVAAWSAPHLALRCVALATSLAAPALAFLLLYLRRAFQGRAPLSNALAAALLSALAAGGAIESVGTRRAAALATSCLLLLSAGGGRFRGSPSLSRSSAAPASSRPPRRLSPSLRTATAALCLLLLHAHGSVVRPGLLLRCGPTTGAASRPWPSHRVLWTCWRGGARVAVVEGRVSGPDSPPLLPNSPWLAPGTSVYRALLVGHSVVGGSYVHPASARGQSVYTAFHLQQAGEVLRPGGRRALLVGLGAGVAAGSLSARGLEVDALELHASVLSAARSHFGARLGVALAGDARDTLAALPDGARYAYVLHDAFAGGEVPASLLAPDFLSALRKRLEPGTGLLSLNYYGDGASDLRRAACALFQAGFREVRAFEDLGHGEELGGDLAASKNRVLLAGQGLAAIDAAAAAQAWLAALGRDARLAARTDAQLARVVAALPRLEGPAPRPEACADPVPALSGAERLRRAAEHWAVMRSQIPDAVWNAGPGV